MVGPLPFTFLAAPPAPQNVVVANGGLKFDAVRSTVSGTPPIVPNPRNFPPFCMSESSLYTNMQDDMVNCICDPLGAQPPIYFHSRIIAHTGQMPPGSQALCVDPSGAIQATPWSSIIGISGEIPQGFVQLYIGNWGAVGSWENQTLLTSVGLIDHLNHCFLDTTRQFHITHGVTTVHDPAIELPHFYDDRNESSVLMIDFVDQVRDVDHMHHAGPNDNMVPIAAGSCLSSLVWTISED